MTNNLKPDNPDIVNINFKEYVLDNGLRVILHKDNANPIVTVDLWYHVGSKNEAIGKTGFAHLFEHLMFQGSKNVKRTEHFRYVQMAGGLLNGSTNQDRTNYYESLPSNQLELSMWLESDRMGYLNVNQENFDNQRDVVKEEKRQRSDNVPYGTKWMNLFKYSFRNEPYEWVPIGSTEDLNNATLEDARSFYKKFYSPSNAVIVIAGDINYDDTIEKVNRYFSKINSEHNNSNISFDIKFNFGEVKEKIYDSVQLPGVFIGYKIPGVTAEDIPALELLTLILGSSSSSRLYSNLVYNKRVAKSAGSFLWDNEFGGLLIISCLGFVNSDHAAIETCVTETIENLLATKISDYELEKAKNSVESYILDSLQTTLGKAEKLAYYSTYFNNTGLVNSMFEKYTNLTSGDILKAASRYLVNNNRVILHYLNKNIN